MSRLRNRMVKAEFWTDPELLRWPLAKRVLYQGLWALAEDSGCLEDDVFSWKLQIFPSPLDADVGLDRLTVWRAELIAAGKLLPYEAAGKRYLFLRTFHAHERPRNPQRPDLPLPPWLQHDSTVHERGGGTVTRSAYSYVTDTVQIQTDDGTVSLLLPPSRPAPSRVPTVHKGRGERQRPVDKSTGPAAVAEMGSNGHDAPTCFLCGLEISDAAVEARGKGLRHKICPASAKELPHD
jgi:hypothetical protein